MNFLNDVIKRLGFYADFFGNTVAKLGVIITGATITKSDDHHKNAFDFAGPVLLIEGKN